MDVNQPSNEPDRDPALPDPFGEAVQGPEEKDFRLKLALFGLAILAAVLAAFAGYPTWQNYMAQQAAKRQLRAYIEVRALGPVALQEGVQPRVRDSIRNLGPTPAYDQGVNAHVTVAEYPLTKPFPTADCRGRNNPPEKHRWFVGRASRAETVRDVPLTVEEIEAVRSAKAAIYFHGNVCYRDIFNDSHRTDFCLFWKWDAGRFSPALYCDHGNSFD